MSTERHAAGERRQGTRERIDGLLATRQNMWVLYERLAGVPPYKEQEPQLLQSFVQVLVDYISSAHFSLYERIVNRYEGRQAHGPLGGGGYPRIAAVTEAAVAFNDKYDGVTLDSVTEELAGHLSMLGEGLAERIELEDRLISAMRK